ncbi:MAG: C4-dicarboxylate ABC transporter substrate-binding protein [Betaproteobacteria bacterium]|nr:C4-dicarboxylate ABC transporter substrate-binding protein [Betaproteobacteria bacterium]
MSRVLRNTLISARDLAITAGPFAALVMVSLVAAYFLLEPTPPRRVVMATGPAGGDYAAFGARYAAALKPYGIEVVLKQTAGSSENRRLLRDPLQQVDLGFVRGGSSDALRASDEEAGGVPLVSLGSMSLEPLWLFYREKSAKKLPRGVLSQLGQLKGWRVNVGARGSGTSGLFGKVLHANGIERESMERTRLESTPAVMGLLEGNLDAILLAATPEASLVQMLLLTPGIRLFEFAQAEAYARRMPYLRPVVLPRGVIDLGRDQPAHDMPLVATTTALILRERTHPALQQLFVQAAQTIHGGTGWIARAGQFPSGQNTELPLAREAERYYRTGPPFLQRYLPFWLANLIDRMWVALVSIIAVLIPLSRVVPPLYDFRIRSRIFRWYRQLRDIEDALSGNAEPQAALLEKLNRLDEKAEGISVPLSYTDELYALRSHIKLVRERLAAAAAALR